MGAIEIATKGILGGVPGTKGFIVISIEEIPITRPKGGYIPTETYGAKRLKKIRIKYIYNDIEYIDEKIVDYDTKIALGDIHLELVNNKPTIKIIL